MKILHIIGARPQFIKYFPIQQAVSRLAFGTSPPTSILVHTGQHYNYRMSQIFFDELGIRSPDYHLDVGSGSHGQQTAMIQHRSEEVLLAEKPDIVVVYGDTNSTLGGALAAAKLQIPVAHIEAGLRSFRKTMPEEINRVLTDHVSTYLLCPSGTAIENLRREGFTVAQRDSGRNSQELSGFGIEPSNVPILKIKSSIVPPKVPDIDHPCVAQVGDVMYDMLLYAQDLAEEKSSILDQLGIEPLGYDLLTLHRAETTDEAQRLEEIITFVNEVSASTPVIFPMHPRMTKAYATTHRPFAENIRIVEPLGYFDLLKALKNARRLLTDSGGMQKEAYWFQVPCITLRDETEWLETIQSGGNILWHNYCGDLLHAPPITPHAYGNGHAAEEIVEIILTNASAYSVA